MKKITSLGVLALIMAFALAMTGSSQAWEVPHDPTTPPGYGFPPPKPPCGDKVWIKTYPSPCVEDPTYPSPPVLDLNEYCKKFRIDPTSNHPCLYMNHPRPPTGNPWRPNRPERFPLVTVPR